MIFNLIYISVCTFGFIAAYTPEKEYSDNIARYFLRQWKLTMRVAVVLMLLFELIYMFNTNDDVTIATTFCLSLILGLLFGIYFTIKISLPAHLFKYESSFDRAWAEINRTEDINYKLKHESKKRKRVMPH